MQTAVFSHQDVLKRGHVRKETDGLKCPGNPALSDAIGAKPGYVPSVEQELARTRLDEAGDNIEEGGLSGPVRTDKPCDRPFLNREVNLGQGSEAIEPLANPFRLQ